MIDKEMRIAVVVLIFAAVALANLDGDDTDAQYDIWMKDGFTPIRPQDGLPISRLDGEDALSQLESKAK